MSERRAFFRSCALALTGLLTSPTERLLAATGLDLGPEDPEAPNEEIARILKQIRGPAHPSGSRQLDMPVVAEDGRVVPVIIETDLPMKPRITSRAVHLIVDHNPDPHLAAFHLTPALGKVSISTRIKMKRTTWVRAILETSAGDVWAGYARVLVTLNGCG